MGYKGAGSAAVATLAAFAILVTGCTAVRTGVAIRDPRIDSGTVNTALLDTGKYNTTPREPLGKAGSREVGALVESRRMAGILVLPFEVDPELNETKTPHKPVVDPEPLNSVFYDNIMTGLARYNLVAGFVTSARAPVSGGTGSMTNAVVRFPTPEDAQAALTDISEHSERDADPADPKTRPARRERPLPDRPDTRAFATETPGLSEGSAWVDLYTYTVHGPFLLLQYVNKKSVDDAVRLATATIDKQRTALDGFTPTPMDKLAELDLDPTGLQAKTIPLPKNANDHGVSGVYNAHGALHFMLNPARTQKLFDDAGVTGFSLGLSNVYLARDAAGANQVADDFVAQIGELRFDGYSITDPVSGIPTSRCLVAGEGKEGLSTPKFRCFASVDRYAIEVMGPDSLGAHRLLAAQYAMLASA